jgi:hypothetical protein
MTCSSFCSGILFTHVRLECSVLKCMTQFKFQYSPLHVLSSLLRYHYCSILRIKGREPPSFHLPFCPNSLITSAEKMSSVSALASRHSVQSRAEPLPLPNAAPQESQHFINQPTNQSRLDRGTWNSTQDPPIWQIDSDHRGISSSIGMNGCAGQRHYWGTSSINTSFRPTFTLAPRVGGRSRLSRRTYTNT